jgi:phosphoglycerate dehydrogenase-like enzyme
MLSHCAKSPLTNRAPLLVNAGRGDLIDDGDVVAAIEKNHICGFVGDVFPTEPLPPSSPLWNHPNVIITPHVAGIFVLL